MILIHAMPPITNGVGGTKKLSLCQKGHKLADGLHITKPKKIHTNCYL